MESSDLSMPEAPTERGRQRRGKIVDAATSLFHVQGFHATSIDEIGTAAGITGPGLYRHFASKDELLLAVFDRIWILLRGAIERAEGLRPDEALDELISTHITLALDHGEALTLLVRELRNVPEYYLRAAERNDAQYTDTWAEVILKLHSKLTLDEARSVAAAIMGMLGAATRERTGDRVPKARQREILHTMARQSLEAF